MAHSPEVKKWAQTPHLPARGRTGYKRSIHESQLMETSCEILRFRSSRNGEEEKVFEGFGRKGFRFCITGGTDDPSLELRISIANEEAGTKDRKTEDVVLKFSAFPDYRHQLKYQDREVIPFAPEKDVELDTLCRPTSKPTHFTDELYDLQWVVHRTKSQVHGTGPDFVTVSWKSKSLVATNLRKALDAEGKMGKVAEELRRIADNSGANSSSNEQSISVDVKWFVWLGYAYRYLLACPTGLVKYWRIRTLDNADKGNVPVGLCDDPTHYEEVYNMESWRPIGWTTDGVEQLNSVDYLDGNSMALHPKFMFTSPAEAEYWLKGALLYEEHLVSELTKKVFDDWYEFSYWEVTKASEDQPQHWLVIVTKDISFYQEQVRLPRTGAKAMLIWTSSDSEESHEWNMKVVGIEFGVTSRASRIALLATQPADQRSIPELQQDGFRSFFKFSVEPGTSQYILDSMDGVLLDSNGACAGFRPIQSILFAREPHQPIPSVAPEKMIQAGNDSRLREILRPLDAVQRQAFTALSKSVVTIVTSSAGCGKTLLASILCAASIQKGEKVLVLTSTDVDASHFYGVALEKAKNLGVEEPKLNGMRLLSPPAGLNDMLSEVFSEEQMQRGSDEGFSTSLVDIMLNGSRVVDVSDATAIFATVDTFFHGSIQDFQPTVLIFDTVQHLPDYIVFSACGVFCHSLERVALFGPNLDDYEESSSVSSTGKRGHLRRQLELTTISRLTRLGVRNIRLNTQYRVDPDISSFFQVLPYRHIYSDGPNAGHAPPRQLMLNWIAKFLQVEVAVSCKVSVFVSVDDGQCLAMKNSSGRLNLQNLIAITRVLKSMRSSGIAIEAALVVTFFLKAVVPIRQFLESQNLEVRVEHVDSEYIKDGPNAVVILDFPYTGHSARRPGQELRNLRRNETALLLPRALRIVVGHQDIGNFEVSGSGGQQFWQRFYDHHEKSRMIKHLRIGRGILKVEHDFRPRRYWIDGMDKVEATKMFEDMRSRGQEGNVAVSGVADHLEGLRVGHEVEAAPSLPAP